jgi:hypothetical protein
MSTSMKNSDKMYGRGICTANDKHTRIRTHIHTHVHTYTHVRTYTHAHTRTHPSTHIHIHTRTHIHTHARKHTRTYTLTHASTYTHTHARMHARTHAHTHLHCTSTFICRVTAGGTPLKARHSYIPSQYREMLWMTRISPSVPISERIKRKLQLVYNQLNETYIESPY